MDNFDTIGTVLLFTVFFIEFTLMLLHKPDKNVIQDMKANFVLGVLVILVGLFEKGLAFGFFSMVYHSAIFKPHLSWWLWIAGFLSCDFIHYLYHWIGHKITLFWAAHITHHSSEQFNLSVGFRINCLHLLYRFLFWSPLCLLGFPPEMILLFESISAVWNFMVHTEKVGKLGILDWMFNTPSNHRVHHASNSEYIDKNYGGILMIYDHLFGTYVKEISVPVYGITHNINTDNAFKILLSEYGRLIGRFKNTNGLLTKFQYLFSKPQ